jgi:hypothetical protein
MIRSLRGGGRGEGQQDQPAAYPLFLALSEIGDVVDWVNLLELNS